MSSDCDYHSSSFMLLTPQSDCEFDLLLASSIQSGVLQSNLQSSVQSSDSQTNNRITPSANGLTIGGRISGGLVSCSLLGVAGNQEDSPVNNQTNNRANNRNSSRNRSKTNNNQTNNQTNNRTNNRTNRNLVPSNTLIASSSSSPSTESTGSSASPDPTLRCDESTNKLTCRPTLNDPKIDFSSSRSDNSSDQSSPSANYRAASRQAINDSIKGNANEVNKFVEHTALDSGGAGAQLTGAELAELSGTELTGAQLTSTHLTGAPLTSSHLTGAPLTSSHLTSTKLTGCLSVSNQLEPIYLLGEPGSHSYDLINVTRSTGFADARLSIATNGAPQSAANSSVAMNRTTANQLAFFKTITNEPDARTSRGRSPVCSLSLILDEFFSNVELSCTFM